MASDEPGAVPRNVTGTIGRDHVNIYTDRSGVGQQRMNCFANRFRTTTCYYRLMAAPHLAKGSLSRRELAQMAGVSEAGQSGRELDS
jgi:hypothetical protein